MAAYVIEPVDINDLKVLIDTQWDAKTGNAIPAPEVTVVQGPREDPSLQWGPNSIRAFVDISYHEINESQDGSAYEYAKIRLQVDLHIWCRREVAAVGGINRQYLHDIKQELRRIIYSNKHSLANWQIIKYQGFEEIFEESISVRFRGKIRLSLENDGIRLPSELADNDLFTRANGVIGAEWTITAGTWEVVSNTAALQSATALAVVRFTPAVTSPFSKNQRVAVDITTADSMDAGLVFRWVDASNFMVVRLEEVAQVKFLRVYQVVATVFTQIAEVREPGWVDGAIIELGVDLYNDCFAVNYQGLTLVNITTVINRLGLGYGLFSDSDQLTRFDNFHVFQSGGDGL